MELLIIPIVLAIGAFFLNKSERTIERQATNDRAKLEREIAKDRQQEQALQSYIRQMSELLLKEKLRTTNRKEVRDVARTLTISVMRVLDEDRKNLVLQFLRETKLVTDKNSILNGAEMGHMNLQGLVFEDVYLQGAHLEEADFLQSYMVRANLKGAFLGDSNLQDTFLDEADIRGAGLSGANLYHASLIGTNLQDAKLLFAFLLQANLQDANIKRANLHNAHLKDAKMERANLESSNLQNANLEGANLESANLQDANLKGAIVTNEQLTKAKSLKGAIMPDGTKHE